MSGRVLTAVLLFAGLASACTPAPRAVSYFKAHPAEIAKVVADCASGKYRGAECENAQAAQAQIDAEARMALYKKSF